MRIAALLLLFSTPAYANDPLQFFQRQQRVVRSETTHSTIVAEAKKHVGARWGGTAWCMRFANHVLRKTGHRTTGSDRAASVLSLPRTTPRPGVLAYWPSHTAILVRVEGHNGVFVSGNWSRRVAVHTYPLRRVHAFVQPQT